MGEPQPPHIPPLYVLCEHLHCLSVRGSNSDSPLLSSLNSGLSHAAVPKHLPLLPASWMGPTEAHFRAISTAAEKLSPTAWVPVIKLHQDVAALLDEVVLSPGAVTFVFFVCRDSVETPRHQRLLLHQSCSSRDSAVCLCSTLHT